MKSFKGNMITSLETLMDRADWVSAMIPGHYPHASGRSLQKKAPVPPADMHQEVYGRFPPTTDVVFRCGDPL